MDEPESPVGRRAFLALLGGGAVAGVAASDGSDGLASARRVGYGGVVGRAATRSTGESEPNDSETTATVVALRTAVSATLTDDDADWFAVELTDGQSFTVVVDRVDGTGRASLRLYGPDGTEFGYARVHSDAPTELTQTAARAGTFYVRVAEEFGGTGEYTLRVESESTATATDTQTTTATATATDTATATATDTDTATPVPTTTVDDEYGSVGYGEYGYGGVVT